MAETAPVPQQDSPSLWSDIKESIRGSHRNYTTGPIGRSILLLAIPMVLEMIMESLFAIVDVFWVSRLGKEAVAVVGLTESVMTLIYAVAIGGSPSDWAERDATIEDERHAAVLVTPRRVYANQPS